MEDFQTLRPVVTEGCNVTLTELDTIYSYFGLVQLNMFLETKNQIGELESLKIKDSMPDKENG